MRDASCGVSAQYARATDVPHDDFDWKPENEDVILPEQRTTAVYVNRWGQAVIRQEKAWDEEDDTFVIIGHAHIPAVIAALQEIAARPVDRDDAPPPRSQTPVERAAVRQETKAAGIAAGSVVDLNESIAARTRESFGGGEPA